MIFQISSYEISENIVFFFIREKIETIGMLNQHCWCWQCLQYRPDNNVDNVTTMSNQHCRHHNVDDVYNTGIITTKTICQHNRESTLSTSRFWQYRDVDNIEFVMWTGHQMNEIILLKRQKRCDLTWCNSCMSFASSTEEHFGNSVAQYFSAFSIHGISCWLRFWYICQWATLPVSAELWSFAREHKLSHCLRTLDNLVFNAEVSLERKFCDIPLASFSRVSRVTWFSATSPAIACTEPRIQQ